MLGEHFSCAALFHHIKAEKWPVYPQDMRVGQGVDR